MTVPSLNFPLYAHICTNIYIDTNMHTHIHIYIQMYMYMCT